MVRSVLVTLGIATLLLVPLAACGGQSAENPQEMVDAAPVAPPPAENMTPPPPPRPATRARGSIPEEEVAPAPRRPAPPATITVSIPEGTQMTVAFVDQLSSANAVIGDDVSVTLGAPLTAGDRVVFPAGSRVEGKVTGVKPATKGYKDTGGAISVSFDRIVAPTGRAAPIVAGFTKVAEGSGAKKGAIIGGSAAGAAVLGKVLDKDAGGAALIGGAIGAAIAGATKGKEAILAPEENVTIALEQPVRVTMQR